MKLESEAISCTDSVGLASETGCSSSGCFSDFFGEVDEDEVDDSLSICSDFGLIDSVSTVLEAELSSSDDVTSLP